MERNAKLQLHASAVLLKKNELIFRMGESVREIGIVLTGSVNIENVDLWGNKSLLNNISAGQVFAETYAFVRSL